MAEPRRRRWWIVAAAVLVVAVVGGLAVGFTVPPPAPTGALTPSMMIDGVRYERVGMAAMSTTFAKSVTVHAPLTTRPIAVVATCRLAVLHTPSARSALALRLVPAMYAGGDIPDTRGAEYFACPNPPAPHMLDTAWLPRDGNELRLSWYQLDTLADTPSTSPATWAFGVYVAQE